MTTNRIDELLHRAAQRTHSLARLPASTYRIQFHAGFTFRDATAIVPYLSDLGITHLYASPYLAAVAGSTHGYDVVDHDRLNPELGTEADYGQLLRTLDEHGLSHVLDTVPNHVGIETNDNAWWNSVLELGRASPFAKYFDITWRGSPPPELHDRVLLPILGDPYDKVLEQGQLKLEVEPGTGKIVIAYFQRRLPLCPSSYDLVLDLRGCAPGGESLRNPFPSPGTPGEGGGEGDLERRKSLVSEITLTQTPSRPAGRGSNESASELAQAVAAFNGFSGDPQSAARMDALLRRQHYRLAWWRDAAEEINYRRFFDINGLAALAMEREDVFAAAHAFTLQLAAQGKITGLRIDHPDGLYDPKEYFRRLQKYYLVAVAKKIAREQPGWNDDAWNGMQTVLLNQLTSDHPALKAARPLYVVAEKILAVDEDLPADWQCDGTSGYDFLVMVNELFVDRAGEDSFTRLYESISHRTDDFAESAYRNKLLVLQRSFACELRRLTQHLQELAARDLRARQFTFGELHDALREIIACFPVYRSYIDSSCVSTVDGKHLQSATRSAIDRNPEMSQEPFYYVRDILLQRPGESFDDDDRARQLRFAGRFQQLTSPTTAKGVEDTAFYQYQRLISLNEVGGEPARFGIDPAELHQYLSARQRHWPHALNALSTHDTKRSEDVRARINVLSEMPAEWESHVRRWMKLNASHRSMVDGILAPARDEEYLIYQTLVGAWPFEGSAGINETFAKRIRQFMQKAMREAKLRTNWTEPDGAWETAVETFIARILDASSAPEFLAELAAFAQPLVHYGLINSLSQTLLRLAAPGVPDTYQGCELWDLSLVDPDNRRPVDFKLRQRLLAELQRGDFSELLDQKDDGRVKLWITSQALRCRRQNPELFTIGEYFPIQTTGSMSHHVFAFGRRHGDTRAVCIVPRLVAGLATAGSRLPLGDAVWRDTRLILPEGFENHSFGNILTGERFGPGTPDSGASLLLSLVLADFPVALLINGAADSI